MAYDWDGKRTRRLQMLRFMGALAIPALAIRLRHCGTAVDRYGSSGRKEGSYSIDLQQSCTPSQTEMHGAKVFRRIGWRWEG